MAEFTNNLLANYGQIALKWLATSGVRVVLIIAGSWIASRILFRLIRRIEHFADDGDPDFQSQREKRAATLSVLLRQVAGSGITLVVGMIVLREFNVDIAPIIAGAGIVGLAVGFGAQSLVKDVIAGFFILFEHQFDVGDVISGAGVAGTVERIALRFTQLRDLEGRVHFIPNGEFRVISNLTRGWSRAVVDIAVGYREDVSRVQGVLTEVAEVMRRDPEFEDLMIEPMEILGVDALGDSAVMIRVLFKTLPGKQWPVAREFRKRVKSRFDALGIEFPFPTRVVHTVALPTAAGPATGDASPGRVPFDGADAVRAESGAGRSETSRLTDAGD